MPTPVPGSGYARGYYGGAPPSHFNGIHDKGVGDSEGSVQLRARLAVGAHHPREEPTTPVYGEAPPLPGGGMAVTPPPPVPPRRNAPHEFYDTPQWQQQQHIRHPPPAQMPPAQRFEAQQQQQQMQRHHSGGVPSPGGGYDAQRFYDVPVGSMTAEDLRTALQYERAAHEEMRQRFATMLSVTQGKLEEIKREFQVREEENAELRRLLELQQQPPVLGHAQAYASRSGTPSPGPAQHRPRTPRQRRRGSQKASLPREARGRASPSGRRYSTVMSPGSNLQTGYRIDLASPFAQHGGY